MQALAAGGLQGCCCLPEQRTSCCPRASTGKAEASGLRMGRTGKLWAQGAGRTRSRRLDKAGGSKRRPLVVTASASASTIIFLSALPFGIVALVWVGVSLMISRIEYEYYAELQEWEKAEEERKRLEEQGLAVPEAEAVKETSESGKEAAEPQPVGAGGGRRNRPIRQE